MQGIWNEDKLNDYLIIISIEMSERTLTEYEMVSTMKNIIFSVIPQIENAETQYPVYLTKDIKTVLMDLLKQYTGQDYRHLADKSLGDICIEIKPLFYINTVEKAEKYYKGNHCTKSPLWTNSSLALYWYDYPEIQESFLAFDTSIYEKKWQIEEFYRITDMEDVRPFDVNTHIAYAIDLLMDKAASRDNIRRFFDWFNKLCKIGMGITKDIYLKYRLEHGFGTLLDKYELQGITEGG